MKLYSKDMSSIADWSRASEDLSDLSCSERDRLQAYMSEGIEGVQSLLEYENRLELWRDLSNWRFKVPSVLSLVATIAVALIIGSSSDVPLNPLAFVALTISILMVYMTLAIVVSLLASRKEGYFTSSLAFVLGVLPCLVVLGNAFGIHFTPLWLNHAIAVACWEWVCLMSWGVITVIVQTLATLRKTREESVRRFPGMAIVYLIRGLCDLKNEVPSFTERGAAVEALETSARIVEVGLVGRLGRWGRQSRSASLRRGSVIAAWLRQREKDVLLGSPRTINRAKIELFETIRQMVNGAWDDVRGLDPAPRVVMFGKTAKELAVWVVVALVPIALMWSAAYLKWLPSEINKWPVVPAFSVFWLLMMFVRVLDPEAVEILRGLLPFKGKV